MPETRSGLKNGAETPRARYAPRRRPRWGMLALVALGHVAAFAGLLHIFAPQITGAVLEQAESLVAITVSPPEPPQPAPMPQETAVASGAAAPEAARDTPREVVAPPAPLPIPRPRPVQAPPAASTGNADRSGAGEQGAGTGAGGAGNGTGSGLSGNGAGAGAITPPVKIDGEINDARDYPLPKGGRETRKGQHVIVYMTVGLDGRARNCRVIKPSNDTQADKITCELAEQRFRFRPAQDAGGNPVVAEYGWRQRWF